jgi:hypothetical protein
MQGIEVNMLTWFDALVDRKPRSQSADEPDVILFCSVPFWHV